MENNNVIFDYTLEQYNKKYRNRRHRLLKYTKEQVNDFDRKYHTNKFLLKERKWCLIGNTYYEIPKAPRFTWYRNLSAKTQIITSAMLGCGVVTSIVVPSVVASSNKPLVYSENISLGEDTFPSEFNNRQKQTLLDNTKIEFNNAEISVSLNNKKSVSDLNVKLHVITVSIEDTTTKQIIKLVENSDYTLERKDDNNVTVHLNEKKEGKYIITPKYIKKDPAPKHVPVSEVKLQATVEVEKGLSIKLIPTVLPSDATNKEVKWTSSNPNLVSVSDDGTINGLDTTTNPVEITCTSKDNPSCSAKSNVSVVPLVSTLKVIHKPTKWIYIVGEKFYKSGIKVCLVNGNKSTDVTNSCTLDIEDGHEFTVAEKIDEKNVTVNFGSLQTTFPIAINGDYSDYLEFYGSTSEITAKDQGRKVPKHLVIPKELGGKTITAIAFGAFKTSNRIYTVDLSKSKITTIKREAFLGVEHLESLIINPELNTMGDTGGGGAFSSCDKLEEVEFLNTDKIYFYNLYYKNFNNTYKLSKLTINSEAFANVKSTDTDYYDPYLYMRGTIYLKNDITLNPDSEIATKYEKADTSDKPGYTKYTFKNTQ